tara:strand:- start:412 stop:534 length:123 start_codon:yes stop_codon:yes gene_type:complete
MIVVGGWWLVVGRVRCVVVVFVTRRLLFIFCWNAINGQAQ